MPTDSLDLIIEQPVWTFYKKAVSCHAVFYPDKDGGYTVIARNLAGVVSEGESIREATDNILEAFKGALESYAACGLKVPWRDTLPEDDMGFELEKHLLVEIDA